MAKLIIRRRELQLLPNIVISFFFILSGCAEADPEAEKESRVKSDVTIYLEGPLLHRGGTVFVVPRELPAQEWKPEGNLPNPTRVDWRLDERKPINAQDRRLGVTISDPVSIVRFDYPQGGHYNFRFLPSIESGVPPEKQGSKLLEVGSTFDYHPSTDKEMSIPSFQVFMILGPDASEMASRTVGSDIKLGYLTERYICKNFEGSLACSTGLENK